MGIEVTIYLKGNNISYFSIIFGGIMWRDMTVSGSTFWCSRTWNSAILVITDRKMIWTYGSSNWDIIVSGNCINYYFPSNMWYLNMVGNYIIIRLGSVECCNCYLCDLDIYVSIIARSIHVSTFPPLVIIFLFIASWTVLDHFITPVLFLFFSFLTIE